jgi:hypothetical protein
MDWLGETGINRVTVSTPYLLEAVKARFPAFKVRVGIYAQVDSPTRARFWEDLGADAITLESFSINRDFERLQAIRAAVSCDLQLIANHSCLPNCPMQPYHQNGFAHSSAGGRRLFIDYCVLRCSRLRLQDPVLFLKSAWIRPEDLAAYEELGFTSFKLLERGIPSSELLARLQAYAGRRWDGDLARLILSYGFEEAPKKQRWWGVRYFLRPGQVSPFKLRPLLELARQQGMLFGGRGLPVTIDNSRIPPDFLARVTACGGAMHGCGDCRYCEQVAREAVRVDEGFRRESLQRFSRAERMLADGSLWHA